MGKLKGTIKTSTLYKGAQIDKKMSATFDRLNSFWFSDNVEEWHASAGKKSRKYMAEAYKKKTSNNTTQL
jgi:hypothetical protein